MQDLMWDAEAEQQPNQSRHDRRTDAQAMPQPKSQKSQPSIPFIGAPHAFYRHCVVRCEMSKWQFAYSDLTENSHCIAMPRLPLEITWAAFVVPLHLTLLFVLQCAKHVPYCHKPPTYP